MISQSLAAVAYRSTAGNSTMMVCIEHMYLELPLGKKCLSTKTLAHFLFAGMTWYLVVLHADMILESLFLHESSATYPPVILSITGERVYFVMRHFLMGLESARITESLTTDDAV